jgi:hypothetical protein
MRLTDALGKTYAAVDAGVAQAEVDEAVAAARRTRAKHSQTSRKSKKR